MSLPTYDKSKRKTTREALPKGAYVVKIIAAKENKWPSGDDYVEMLIDIAEGAHADYFRTWMDSLTTEDKKWPFDGRFNLNVPHDGCEQFVWDNWNTFFADLEDSNNGFVFGGNVKTLKGKLIGGKFHIVESEYRGTVYQHTRMKWTCCADDVRTGKAGKLPNDKLLSGSNTTSAAPAPATDAYGFANIPEGVDTELPF